jgi:hypothetical protein
MAAMTWYLHPGTAQHRDDPGGEGVRHREV